MPAAGLSATGDCSGLGWTGKRRLLRVEIPEGAQLETDKVVSDLMGKDPQTRFREIMEWMALVEEVDV